MLLGKIKVEHFMGENIHKSNILSFWYIVMSSLFAWLFLI